MSDPFAKGIIQQWDRWPEFRALLEKLANNGAGNNFPGWSRLSSQTRNFNTFAFSLGMNQHTIQSNFVLWFIHRTTMQASAFIHDFWTVLNENSFEAALLINIIRSSDFEYVFNPNASPGQARTKSSAPKSTPEQPIIHLMREPILAYFRDSPGWVNPSIQDKTVLAELERCMEHPIVQLLEVANFPAASDSTPLINFLRAYPLALPLIAIALLQCNACDPFTNGVRLKTGNILQMRQSEQELIDTCIRPIIQSLPLARLVQFKDEPGFDYQYFPTRFNGVNMDVLRQLMIAFGTDPEEVRRFKDPHDFIYAVQVAEGRLSREPFSSVERLYSFKLETLHLLRALDNGNSAIMFPWLSSEELADMLNPPAPLRPDQVISIPLPALSPAPAAPVVTNTPFVPSLQLNELLSKARVARAMDFAVIWHNADYDLEDLVYVLEKGTNPELLNLLTDAERVRLIRHASSRN